MYTAALVSSFSVPTSLKSKYENGVKLVPRLPNSQKPSPWDSFHPHHLNVQAYLLSNPLTHFRDSTPFHINDEMFLQ